MIDPKPYPIEHIDSEDCPCGPTIAYEDEYSVVYVHRDLSGKEFTETDNPALN